MTSNFDHLPLPLSSSDTQKAQLLEQLKTEIIENEGIVMHSFLALGKAWKKIRDEELWRYSPLKHTNFTAFIEKECHRQKSTAYNLIGIYEIFGQCIHEQNVVVIEHSKLTKLLPLANEHNAKYLLNIACTASKKDFKKFLDANKPKKPTKSRMEYGDPLEFNGLRHAPLNEQGVVYLFGMLSQEMGFNIEAVRTAFPDCVGKRKILEKQGKWEQVKIEFEHKSSNFKQHGHDPEKCNLIICWEHDWLDCPIEVISLKEFISNRK